MIEIKSVEMPRDYHVIIVIVVLEWAFPLRDIQVKHLVIKSVLNARSLTTLYIK